MDMYDSGRTIPPMGDYQKGDTPWPGGLLATLVRAGTKVRLPLERVTYEVQVAGCLASVRVTQQYMNDCDEHLEAVYTFPLSGGAAVSDFTMKTGDRVVKGVVKERGKARREYRNALQQGKRASLVEQERSEIFTMQVGNIPAGESVTVELTYSEKLPFFQEGNTELRLPLVVAPRYIPGAPLQMGAVGTGEEPDTDVVPDASRISPPLLPPGSWGDVELSISIDLRRGSPGEEISCIHSTSHSIEVTGEEGIYSVGLGRSYVPLNRDFVLCWTVAGPESHSSFYTYHDPIHRQVYGMVTLFPPRQMKKAGVSRDLIFLLDRSGSMNGLKMPSAARACSLLLGTLTPEDRFAIMAFDDMNEWMPVNTSSGGSSWLVRADEAGIERGERYLRTIQARGGTEIYGALRDALEVMAKRGISAAGREPVIVLLTDGEVGNERHIYDYVRAHAMGTRIFAVGIDTAVNDGFLKKLAALGRGTSITVQPGADLDEALRAIAREIGRPLVTDLQFCEEETGLVENSMAPGIIPDLFAGRPSTFYFRLRKVGEITVVGRYADGSVLAERLTPCQEGPPALAHLWARMRAHDLEDQYYQDLDEKIKRKLINIAVRHNILTPFTAFVVVDEEVVYARGPVRQVPHPVCQPAGWSPAGGHFSSPFASYGGSGYRGGGCIRVDLLPAERKKFGFNPLELLVKLMALPFYLVFLIISELIRWVTPWIQKKLAEARQRSMKRKGSPPHAISMPGRQASLREVKAVASP